ncbi:MAG: restriction endonuclease subunit S [Proteobacteria bacterium]|nr:restriction endonuclease subunit S [Pseudomonadota bacterium]
MSRYKAYSECRDSGLQWLGDIPDHWKVIQSRRLFAQRKERARPVDEQLTASQKYGVIYQKLFMELEGQSVVQVQTGSDILKHVEQNDFVISMRSFQGGLEWCQYPGSVSSAYVGIIPVKHVVPEFFRYLFKAESYIQALQSTSNLVRDGQALRFENFSQVHLPQIPESEQKAIAAFLDHETAKIDALIEKQQRLIELLKEKRQAVISHAVTKGLNPNAPMKDSGVEWLGEVPAHWEIRKFNHCTSIKSGQVDPTEFPYSGFTLIAPNHIESGTGKIISLKTAQEQGADSGKYLCSEGEVIYSKIRPALAKVCISPSNQTICSADMYPICANGGLLNEFLYWSLLSTWFTSFVILESDRVAMPKINREKLAEISLPIPPTHEQTEISEYLKKQTSTVDVLLDKARSGIELLQERRTALISAAVTGKIDVRDWQPAAA